MHITKNVKEKCIMARIMRQNQKYQKNFTLNEYKSWTKAEREAKKWVKEMLEKLPDRATSKGKLTSRNTSGVVGVRLVNSVKYKNGSPYESWRWLAFWPDCPYRGGISWATLKYGDDEAFVLAVLSRKMESIDREAILKKFNRIKGKKSYNDILALKQLKLV